VSALISELSENLMGQSEISKPKNARSKRALEAREPKEVEDPRTVIFVRGTHTGEVVNGVMKDLVRDPISDDCFAGLSIVLCSLGHEACAQAAPCNFILKKERRTSVRGRDITRILGTQK
jgi:hypothetical protein